MTFSRFLKEDCMRLGITNDFQTQKRRKTIISVRPTYDKEKIKRKAKKITRRQIVELLFENCIDCEKMAAIPQGAFAVHKVRRNQDRGSSPSPDGKEKLFDNCYNAKPFLKGIVDLTPLQYNSKLMNSIWGLYNRYSVHNFKKNTADNDVFVAAWGAFLKNRPPRHNSLNCCCKNSLNFPHK